MPQTERHVGVWFGGLGHRIGDLITVAGRDLREAATLGVEAVAENVVLVPGDFALAHPERGDLDFVLRRFVVSAARFAVRTSHQVLAARDWDHVERDVGACQHLCIFFHFSGGLGFGIRIGNGCRQFGRRGVGRFQSAAA